MDPDHCMLFLPNMSQVTLKLSDLTPSQKADEVIKNARNLYFKHESATKKWHLVDTNFTCLTDLSWHMSLPQNQVALFIMSIHTYRQGQAQKKRLGDKFEFNAFVASLAQ